MSEENKTAQAPANEPSMATAPTGAPAGTPVQELTVQDLGVFDEKSNEDYDSKSAGAKEWERLTTPKIDYPPFPETGVRYHIAHQYRPKPRHNIKMIINNSIMT